MRKSEVCEFGADQLASPEMGRWPVLPMLRVCGAAWRVGSGPMPGKLFVSCWPWRCVPMTNVTVVKSGRGDPIESHQTALQAILV